MTEITSDSQQESARYFKHIYSTYRQNKDLISVGAYQTGSDPLVDESIALYPHLVNFLQQGINQSVSLEDSVELLEKLRELVQVQQKEVTVADNPSLVAGEQQGMIIPGNWRSAAISLAMTIFLYRGSISTVLAPGRFNTSPF